MSRQSTRQQDLQLLTCSSFLENAILPPPLIIDKDDPLVSVGTTLLAKEVSCAVIRDKNGVYKSIQPYQIISLLLQSKPDEMYGLLYEPVSKFVDAVSPSSLPLVHSDDPFAKALTKMGKNRFTDVMVLDDHDLPSGMFSVRNVVRFLSGRTDSIGMSLEEVSSRLIPVDGEESIIDVFRFMVRNRVKRAVIKEGEAFYCCTESEAMSRIFSFAGLNLLRDDPDTLLKMPIEWLVHPFQNHVPSLSGGLDVAEGWIQASWTSNCTLVVDDERIATPWDLVMKPFESGKLIV